ncbi:hypothetical protein OG320_17175 [Microbispora sp. NBC_01189]|uniref:hypothetical protein n=1 Tax=Microbispora sp. NBC_01189 TaxID=2903583 RepID=UPI002E0EE62F|nr:hypothetical protein OG320_17175 [Microbispora sp. NBC_01189]
MKVPVRQLLWVLAGVVTVLVTYAVVAIVLFRFALSLYLLPVLVWYTPLALLAIGVLGAAISAKVPARTQPTMPALSRLSFWCGWAICPAGWFVLLLLGR